MTEALWKLRPRKYPRFAFWTWTRGFTIRVYCVGLYLGLPFSADSKRPRMDKYEASLGFVGVFRWGRGVRRTRLRRA